MAFHLFTTKRVSCFGQYDRIDDLITFKLRGEKRPVFRQFLVDEFHFSSVFKFLDPLFIWHVRSSSGEVSVCRKCTLFAAKRFGPNPLTTSNRPSRGCSKSWLAL